MKWGTPQKFMQTDAKFGEDGSDGHCCSSAAVGASGSGPALVGLTGQMLLGKDEKSLTHPRNNGSQKDDIRNQWGLSVIDSNIDVASNPNHCGNMRESHIPHTLW